MIRDIVNRARTLVRRGYREDELDEEVRFHLEMQTRDNVRRGMSPPEARRAAHRRFGAVEQVKEECRDSWGVRFVDSLVRDVRFALRGLRRTPAFTVVVVLTVATGVGANTAVFSMVNGVLLRSLPFAAGDRLVALHQLAQATGADDIGISFKEINDYRHRTRALDAIAEYHSMYFNLFGRGEARRVATGVVSANFFPMLGVHPVIGRLFVPADDTPGAPPVLVLGYGYWERVFGRDPSIVGRTVEMNDRVHTVVGVLQPLPAWPDDNDVFMPSFACPFRSKPQMLENRAMRMVRAFGRLKEGTTIEQASRDVAGVASTFATEHPESYEDAAGFSATLVPVSNDLVRRARATFLLLLATTGFVLLLVCANVANLVLARLRTREHELALRSALGADRRRLIRQLVTESLVLSLSGGAAGVIIALFVQDLLVSYAARLTPLAAGITVDTRVLLFALVVSIATGLAFGLLPLASRHERLAPALHATRGAVGRGGRTRQALIVSQVAISFIVLIGAGLLARSFIKLQQVDPGFKPQHVLSMQVDLDWSRYSTPEARRAFFGRLLERVGTIAGVRSSALALTFPLNESTPFNTGFTIEGQPPPSPGRPAPIADFRVATADYFTTIGTPLVRGRSFTVADRDGAPPVAIVNESLVAHRFGGKDPVGQRVSLDSGATWVTIVGVVGDVRQYGLDRPPADEMYLSFLQQSLLGATVLLRTEGDPMAVAREAREAVRGLDERQPVVRVRTLQQVRDESLASRRLTVMLMGLFAVLALMVTCAGIVGVVSFSVNQRMHEIGVRMALGADRARVVAMVIAHAMRPVLVGLACGAAVALSVSGVVASLLFDVRPTDPLTFAAVVVALGGVAVIACLVPARRASGVSPLTVLREG